MNSKYHGMPEASKKTHKASFYNWIPLDGESGLNKRFCLLVRHRSSQIASLLQDEEKIREERKKAKNNRNRYVGVASESGGSFGRFGGMSSDDYSYRASSFQDRDDEGFAASSGGHQEPVDSSSSTAWRLSGYWADTPNSLKTESSRREHPSSFARYSDYVPDQPAAVSSPTKKPEESEGSHQHIVASSYDLMSQQRPPENLAGDDFEKGTGRTSPMTTVPHHPPVQMPRMTFDQHLNIGKYALE